MLNQLHGFEIPASLALLLSFFMPALVHLVMTKVAAKWREPIALLISAAIAGIVMAMIKYPSVAEWIGALGIVYTIAQIAYKKFWQPFVLGPNDAPKPKVLNGP